jgi:hypothetical protein
MTGFHQLGNEELEELVLAVNPDLFGLPERAFQNDCVETNYRAISTFVDLVKHLGNGNLELCREMSPNVNALANQSGEDVILCGGEGSGWRREDEIQAIEGDITGRLQSSGPKISHCFLACLLIFLLHVASAEGLERMRSLLCVSDFQEGSLDVGMVWSEDCGLSEITGCSLFREDKKL